MNNTIKQKYAIYRDNELIGTDVSSLAAIGAFAKKDARREHAEGRAAHYRITGSLGFQRLGSHFRGRVRWDSKLKLGALPETGRCV